MLYDAKFEIADDATLVASTTTAWITTGKEIDWTAKGLDMGQGTPLYFNLSVGTTAYVGGTTCQFFLEVDDTSESHDGTGKRIMMTDELLVTDLTAGAYIYSGAVPVDVDADRYLLLGITTDGATSSGTVNAWFSNAPMGSVSDTQVDESNI